MFCFRRSDRSGSEGTTVRRLGPRSPKMIDTFPTSTANNGASLFELANAEHDVYNYHLFEQLAQGFEKLDQSVCTRVRAAGPFGDNCDRRLSNPGRGSRGCSARMCPIAWWSMGWKFWSTLRRQVSSSTSLCSLSRDGRSMFATPIITRVGQGEGLCSLVHCDHTANMQTGGVLS